VKPLTDANDQLQKWMQGMHDWGRLVRRDIKALEKAVNDIEAKCCNLPPTPFAKPPKKGRKAKRSRGGDPGDPPVPPT
jgi:hypothetical protein